MVIGLYLLPAVITAPKTCPAVLDNHLHYVLPVHGLFCEWVFQQKRPSCAPPLWPVLPGVLSLLFPLTMCCLSVPYCVSAVVRWHTCVCLNDGLNMMTNMCLNKGLDVMIWTICTCFMISTWWPTRVIFMISNCIIVASACLSSQFHASTCC